MGSAKSEQWKIYLTVLLKEILTGLTVFLVWLTFKDLFWHFSDKIATGLKPLQSNDGSASTTNLS